MAIVKIGLIAQFSQIGVERYHRVLGSEIASVVDPPKYFSDPARRMEESLQNIAHKNARAKADSHGFNGIHDAPDDVWTRLKDVRPDQVHKMNQRVLIAKSSHTQSEMFHDGAGGLSMNVIPVRQSVLQHAHDRMYVVLRHLPDVLEDERECLETTIPYVQFGRTIFVENRGYACERTTGFGHDRCKR